MGPFYIHKHSIILLRTTLSHIISNQTVTSEAQTYLVHVPMEGLRSSSISSIKQQCPDTDVRAKRNRTRMVRCVGCVPYQQSTSK